MHLFCEVNLFFFKRKKEKNLKSIRTDYYLIGIFVMGGWGNSTLVLSPVLKKSLRYQTENVLIIFCQQFFITVLTRLYNSKHKIAFNLVV